MKTGPKSVEDVNELELEIFGGVDVAEGVDNLAEDCDNLADWED